MGEVHVVTHVHWDREWYRSFERFRAMLAELVDAVCDQLERGALAHFLLDGQTVAVADHLALHPESEPRLRALVGEGRLTIGPWHVLADMTLVSGEALVRNLLVGRRWMRRLGRETVVGYCPDMFGHPPDLPAILRGFGIDSAVVWRGAPEIPRFAWRAPDGSQVTTVRSRYYEPEVLWAIDGIGARFAGWVDTQRQRDPEGPWLLLNGGDHLAPRDVAPRLAALADSPTACVESRLDDYLAALDAAPTEVVVGELREVGRDGAFLLAGTLSTRAPLKQANAAAQVLLERWAEPLVVAASSAGTPTVMDERGTGAGVGRDEELRGLLRHAWDELLCNHAHDSICGCGADAVHREDLVRFERVLEAGEHLLERCLRRLGLVTRVPEVLPVETTWVAVINPHGMPVTAGVELDLLVAPGRAPVAVVAPDGTPVEWSAVDAGTESLLVTDVDVLPRWPHVGRWRLRLVAVDVPAGGWAAYRVRLGDAVPGSGREQTTDDGRFERDGWHVAAAPDGSIRVRTPQGSVLEGLGRLVDEGDAGDSYTAQVVGAELRPRLARSRVVRSAVDSRLQLTCSLELPVGLASGRGSRSEEAVVVPVDAEIVKWRGIPQLEWRIRVDNRARDHRLRAVFPTGLRTATWLTDAAFSSTEREVPAGAPEPVTQPGQEEDPRTAPMQRWLSTGNGSERIAVLTSGLHEGAARRAPDGTTELLVTLLRSIGWIGRFDVTTRTMGAGPPIEVPDAQCLGEHRFRWAVRLGDDELELAAAAESFRAPPRAVQVFGPPPARRGAVVRGALLSADKPAEDGRDRVLRVWNPTSSDVEATVELDAPVTRVIDSDLDERAGAAREVVGGLVRVPVRRYGTHTLRITPGSSG